MEQATIRSERMVAFSFWRKAMRWCFWVQMEDLGRMESRVMQEFHRSQARVISLSSFKLDHSVFMSGVIEAEENHALRVESLLEKIQGMESAKIVPETDSVQRMIALFRILTGMTEQAEVLHFVSAVSARAIVLRPLWVTFEVVGTPQEIESIYQSARAYGIVDIFSSACVLMIATNERN
jgi:acetolactate synthase small subunit